MKKLFLSLLALVILGIGAYVWANWISYDEVDDLLTGEFVLADWQVTSNCDTADSLVVCQTPIRGMKVQIELSDEHGFRLKGEDDAPVMQAVVNYSWKPLFTLRNCWFGTVHALQRCYASTAVTDSLNNALNGTRWKSGLYSQATANFYPSRKWIGATHVALVIDLIDPENQKINWQLHFVKK